MLTRLQRGLERLYRIETELRVDDFLIDAGARERLGVARSPREQLLLSQTDGDRGRELEIGLFVDARVLDNLARHDPEQAGLHEHNLHDFLLTVEGVSHFVYVAWRARADVPVSALELELQAEVDKYVTCLLLLDGLGRAPSELRRRLFEEMELADDLDDEERVRYQVANENAHRYTASLEARFVRPRRLHAMLGELRRFYRLSLRGKLEWIRDAA
jgi:hypothetical protein